MHEGGGEFKVSPSAMRRGKAIGRLLTSQLILSSGEVSPGKLTEARGLEGRTWLGDGKEQPHGAKQPTGTAQAWTETQQNTEKEPMRQEPSSFCHGVGGVGKGGRKFSDRNNLPSSFTSL